MKHHFPKLNVLLVILLSFVVGCSNATEAEKGKEAESDQVWVGNFIQTELENGEASHIQVQHVLIGFEGSVPGKDVTRSKEEAEALANEILEKARSGTDFFSLVEEHSDDSYPGIYNMANFGQRGDMEHFNQTKIVFSREGMVGAFGNVGFPLKAGEVGIANYDPEESKYGWHVIKRLR